MVSTVLGSALISADKSGSGLSATQQKANNTSFNQSSKFQFMLCESYKLLGQCECDQPVFLQAACWRCRPPCRGACWAPPPRSGWSRSSPPATTNRYVLMSIMYLWNVCFAKQELFTWTTLWPRRTRYVPIPTVRAVTIDIVTMSLYALNDNSHLLPKYFSTFL